jgi:hypothetical protein
MADAGGSGAEQEDEQQEELIEYEDREQYDDDEAWAAEGDAPGDDDQDDGPGGDEPQGSDSAERDTVLGAENHGEAAHTPDVWKHEGAEGAHGISAGREEAHAAQQVR